MTILKIMGVIIAGLAVVVSAAPSGSRSKRSRDATTRHAQETVVDSNGNLRVPKNYRSDFEFLGSWAIASDNAKGSKALHIVYASRGTIAAYRKDGRFPDGTVLVKEVFQTETQPMKTGTVSHAATLQGWFVMVKESKDLHPSNKLWGDGWAWSWFNRDNPVKTTSTNFKVDCLPCHEPARATDWIYVPGYPPLRSAR